MKIKPVELRQANEFIAQHHRHHKPVQGHRFSIGVEKNGELVGVATVGRPVARRTPADKVLEVTRLCTNGTRNACSALYAAAARIGKELGYWKIQTFILDEETGASLRASGWQMDGVSPGGNWGVPSRPERRQDQPQGPKQRWIKILNNYDR